MPDITFHSIDTDQNVLGSALVKVYSIDGSVLHDYGITSNSAGTLTLTLSAGEYWVRCFKSEYAFNKRLKLTVGTADEDIDLKGANTVDYLPSGSPEVCRVSGITYGASGEPSESGHATFVLAKNNYRINDSGILTSAVVRGYSDKFGRVSFELIRGATYECRYKSREDQSFLVTVPDLEVCKLSDLLFPIGTAFTCASTVTGTKGEELKEEHSYELSLGRTITSDENLEDFFEVDGDAHLSKTHIIFNTKTSRTYTVKIYGVNKDAVTLGSAKQLLKTITVTVND